MSHVLNSAIKKGLTMPHHTPWKKSRKYGDIYGGRQRPKFADNIRRRVHSLKRPEPGQNLPILIEENPSRDFFHPLSANEAVHVIKSLPKRDWHGITHVWLRRPRKTDYDQGCLPFACYMTGSGVRVVVLYAWSNDLVFDYGFQRPQQKYIKEYSSFGAVLIKQKGRWKISWNENAVRRFCVHVLFHEVGHHVDYYRRRLSRANNKSVEEFAEQYAFVKSPNGTYVFNELENNRLYQ